MRMTGCPNGCVRPYQSDIGIVGRSGDKYTLFVGGHVLRPPPQLRAERPGAAATRSCRRLVPLLEMFKKDREGKEGFGDFCRRLGQEKLQALVA